MTLNASDLGALAASEEIEIETRSPAGNVHRTIVWIVVHDGVAYLRSVNGAGARWYREAMADPGSVAIHVDGRRIPVRLVDATDPLGVAAASAGLREKYRGDPSLRSMLEPHTLQTTLRVYAA